MLKNIIKVNTYYDSVTLMAISQKISVLDGVEKVSVMMATDNNKDILEEGGLLTEAGHEATPGDLIIAFSCQEESQVSDIVERVELALGANGQTVKKGKGLDQPIRTIGGALNQMPDANLAFISVPGEYATGEVLKALNSGLDVFLFSDNVSLSDELFLKKEAQPKGLLVMGPDCGTAYLNGVALGFANVVPKGDIGLVAASGTGLQEVTCLIAKNGGGISQAIGTGGRDLKEAIGGITMLQGIELLAEDSHTKVLVLISKPPAPQVEEKIMAALEDIGKPIVICFLGGEKYMDRNNNIYSAQTLEEAANMALALARGEDLFRSLHEECLEIKEIAAFETDKFSPEQKYIRGLFSGGTLCYEALLIFNRLIGDAYSNLAYKPEFKLTGTSPSVEHTFIDLGDDEFTRGRPHPMIDPSQRKERILLEAVDPGTAVILLDIVLGYGANADPAGELVPVINEARAYAASNNRHLCFFASVCGTQGDSQGYNEQIKKLEKAGVVVMSSNAEAARLAVRIAHNLARER